MKKIKRKTETPIADFLTSNALELNANFHALPIFHMQTGMKGFNKYNEIFGNKFLSLETTITGKVFDSFFYPQKEIKKSQRYAAEIFGANDTLYVTCGTSISNYISVDALVNDCSHVLLDRECHQSLHFAINNKKVKFDYLYSEKYCEITDRKYFKLSTILKKVQEAVSNNTPYDVIIINASSYDGVIYNIYEIIKNIIAVSPSSKFLIDEAWSSAFYFHPKLYKYTAGYAHKKLGKDVNIVATQSAHKSLMTLRQASLIHSFANDNITEKLYKSRFKLHSTSPSYPILASIDLARAQMQSCGLVLLNTALNNADIIKNALQSDKLLKSYYLNNQLDNLENLSEGICSIDPLKIHLDIRQLNMRGADLQEYLYYQYEIYFNRYTENTALINIHIGINEQHVNLLLRALKKLLQAKRSKEIVNIDDNDFIISYPPGIPLHAPGEELNQKKMGSKIKEKIKNGISVFQVN